MRRSTSSGVAVPALTLALLLFSATCCTAQTLQCNTVTAGNDLTLTNSKGSTLPPSVDTDGPYPACLYWSVKGNATVGGQAMVITGTDGAGYGGSNCSKFGASQASSILAGVQAQYKAFTSSSLQALPTVKCCDNVSLCNQPLTITVSPVPTLQCNTVFGNPFTVTNDTLKGSVTISQSPIPTLKFASCLSWSVTGSMTIAGQLNTISGTDGSGGGTSCSQLDTASALIDIRTFYKSVNNTAGSISLTPPTTFSCCDSGSLCNTPLAVTFSGSSKPEQASQPLAPVPASSLSSHHHGATGSLFIVAANILLGIAFISKSSPL